MVYTPSATADHRFVPRLAAAPAPIELPIVQMLCSRLCHDLAGPAGAIGAGSEMLGEADGGDPEALELVAFGARQLGARLGFYRIAFGFGGTPAHLSWPGVRALAGGLFEGGRVTLDWAEPVPEASEDVPAEIFRLGLLLLLLGSEALPRGGTLAVTVAPARPGCLLSIRAAGRAAALAPETLAALAGGTASAVTSRTVTAFYAARLAEAFGASIDVEGQDGAVELRVALPKATAAI